MNFRCSRLGGWAAAAAVTTRGLSDASRGFVRHPDAWNGIGLLLWVLSAWVAITGTCCAVALVSVIVQSLQHIGHLLLSPTTATPPCTYNPPLSHHPFVVF